jgi:hypothetical protein
MIAHRETLHMRFTRLSVGLLGIVALSACSTDLTSLNANPNSPTTAPATALFTNAAVSSVSTFNGSFNTLSMTELFAQHIAQIQYIDEDRGHIRPGTLDALWTNQYAGPLKDLQKVIAMSDSAKLPSTAGPGRVLSTWIFQNMTDLWGDIPYSKALNGEAGGAAYSPAYDTQKDVYYGMLQSLTDASTGMAAGVTVNDPGLGSADPIYKGDDKKWVKLSNSLRARLALRMSKADPAKAATEITAAFAGGVMASTADNAILVWPGDGVYNNPWASNFSGRDDHRMAKTLIDTLNTLNDPRLPIYAQPTACFTTPTTAGCPAGSAQYAGMRNGLDNTYTAQFFNTTSRPGAIFYPGKTSYGTFGTSAGNKTPSYIMTFAEVSFIQAEAAQKGLGGLNAAQAAGFYNAGVTASMDQWGVSPGAAAAYLAQPGVAYVAGTGLAQIGLQKWIALFTQGTEAWSEWRRTGLPATILPGPSMYTDPSIGGVVPQRLLYPPGEQASNGASLAAAITDQGADTQVTKVWWAR